MKNKRYRWYYRTLAASMSAMLALSPPSGVFASETVPAQDVAVSVSAPSLDEKAESDTAKDSSNDNPPAVDLPKEEPPKESAPLSQNAENKELADADPSIENAHETADQNTPDKTDNPQEDPAKDLSFSNDKNLPDSSTEPSSSVKESLPSDSDTQSAVLTDKASGAEDQIVYKMELIGGASNAVKTYTDQTGSYPGFYNGETVMINAQVPFGKKFVKWEVTDGTVQFVNGSEKSETASFTMPSENVRIEAIFVSSYLISISNGYAKADGKVVTDAYAGENVTITANALKGKKFISWKVNEGDAVLSDPQSQSTSFVMPQKAVTIEPVYKDSSLSYSPFDSGASLALKSSGTLYVGTAFSVSQCPIQADGLEEIIYTWTFPDTVCFNRFLSTFQAPDNGALKVEIYEKGASVWKDITNSVFSYKGDAQAVKVTVTSKAKENDLSFTMPEIIMDFTSKAPNDPDDKTKPSMKIYGSVVGYTAQTIGTAPQPRKQYSLFSNISTNHLSPIVLVKQSIGPKLVCDKPKENTAGSTFTTTLSSFSGPNAQKAVMTYTYPDNVEFYAIEQYPTYTTAIASVEYLDEKGSWNAYDAASVDAKNVKGIRFIGSNPEYGVEEVTSAKVAFKCLEEGSGKITVTTNTLIFGDTETFRDECSYEISGPYLSQSMAWMNEITEIESKTPFTDNVRVNYNTDLTGSTIHYKQDSVLKTLSLSFGDCPADASVIVSHANGISSPVVIKPNESLDLSQYDGVSDIQITPATVLKDDVFSFEVTMMSKEDLPVSVTNTVTTEAKNARDTVNYNMNHSLNILCCVIDDPNLIYSGNAVEFGDTFNIRFGGVGFTSSMTSSDYTYTITVPTSVPVKEIILPSLNDYALPITDKIIVQYTLKDGTVVDLGEMSPSSSIDTKGKILSGITLSIKGGDRHITTAKEGKIIFENSNKNNTARVIYLKADAKVSYKTPDDVISKSFTSTGIELKLSKDSKEPDDPGITPSPNPGSNKGRDDDTKTPETEKPKETEKKKPENTDVRKAQEAATQRSSQRSSMRGRIAIIRKNMLEKTALAASSPGSSNQKRITQIQKDKREEKNRSIIHKTVIKKMLITDKVSSFYETYGIYPIPEEIVSFNAELVSVELVKLYADRSVSLIPECLSPSESNSKLAASDRVQTSRFV